MAVTDLLADARTALQVLWAPGRTFAALAARPRALVAIAIFSASLALTARVAVTRVDYGAGAAAEERGAGGAAAEPTEFEREQARQTAARIGALVAWSEAAALPTGGAAVVALVLLAAFWVAGTSAAFRPTFAVAAHAAMPLALRSLLQVPALLAHPGIAAAEVRWLLPSSLGALLPAGAPAALRSGLGAVDLFALWTVALAALGMSRLTGVSRLRAALATALPWAALVALTMAAAAATAAPPPVH